MDINWHNRQWENIVQRWKRGSLPHALLLTGPHGLGKSIFADNLVKSVLCERPADNGHACDHCKNCQLVAAGSHPDIHEVGVAEESKVIKIDQIRDLCEKLSKTSQLAGYKVGIIRDAERMNTNAANSLLKTLEEPGADTLIVLLSSQPGTMPATIRSRCQKISFNSPEKAQALEWLKKQTDSTAIEVALALSQGAPLAALELLSDEQISKRKQFLEDFQSLTSGKQDPIVMSEKWVKLDPEALIHWLQGCVMDIIRLKSAQQPPIINNIDIISYLKPLSQRLDLKKLFNRLERLEQAGRQLQTQVNTQLILEDTLMSWAMDR
jgi:DNA polymerase-3 subunit delta'